MPRVKDVSEILFFFLLTFILYLLFLSNLPFLWEPRGGLPLSEIADFSDRRLIPLAVFGSVVLCALLGSLLMKRSPSMTAGTLAAYWGTTFLLLWVDGAPVFSMPSRPFYLLGILGLGAFFLGLYFFTLDHLRQVLDGKKGAPSEGDAFKAGLLPYWLGSWMSFYFLVSVLLILRSEDYIEPPLPLALGYGALSFLNFILLLRSPGMGNARRSIAVGGVIYGLWSLYLLWFGWGGKWPH